MGKLGFAATAIAAIAVLGSCTDLPAVTEEGCGNLVLNTTEDCDGFSAFGEGTSCGAVGTVNACHYVCDATNEIDCPSGWGCGSDSRCRRPGGDFVEVDESPWRFKVFDFTVGDVDGDKKDDLIGHNESSISVRFGSGTGSFATDLDVVIAQPTGPVEFGLFNDDEMVDSIVPTAGGLFTLLGQKDRTLEPYAYSPFSVPLDGEFRLVPVESDRLNNLNTELLLVATISDDMNEASVMGFLDSIADGEPLPDGFHTRDLVGRLPIADIGIDPDGREEFALAFSGAPSVWVYSSVGSAGDGPVTVKPDLAQTIAVPGTVYQGARFTDVDLDGELDLMISYRDNSAEPQIGVAYGLGNGALSALVWEQVFDSTSITKWALGSSGPFYAYPDMILRAHWTDGVPGGAPDGMNPVAFPTTAEWNEALFGDFNGDGETDFAATVEGNDGIDVFLNDADGFFNRFHLDTDAPPQSLRLGDFDGDLIDDIAFVESGFGFEPDGLSVIFGSTSGGPSEAVSMGRPGILEAIETVSTVFSAETFDGINDLFVVSASFPDRETRALAIMQGSSSRRLLSPFTLFRDGNTQFPDVPTRPMIADFDSDGVRDIATIAGPAFGFDGTEPANTEFRQDLFVVRGTGGEGNLDASSTAFEPLPDLEEFESDCAVWTAGDIDGDGVTEIVGVDRSEICGGFGDLGASRLIVGTVSESGFMAATQDFPDEDYRAPKSVELVDVDGDGDLDLVVVFFGNFTDDPNSGEFITEGSAIVVVWNNGGNLTAQSTSVVDVSEAGIIFDVAVAEIDGDSVPELVILAEGAVFSTALDPDTGAYSPLEYLFEAFGEGSIGVGDLNGDGLQDIANTSFDEVHVWLGQAGDPLGADIEELEDDGADE
jgi:hypothetical protein